MNDYINKSSMEKHMKVEINLKKKYTPELVKREFWEHRNTSILDTIEAKLIAVIECLERQTDKSHLNTSFDAWRSGQNVLKAPHFTSTDIDEVLTLIQRLNDAIGSHGCIWQDASQEWYDDVSWSDEYH